MNDETPAKPRPSDFISSPSVLPTRPLQQETFDLDEEALWEAMESRDFSAGILENYLTDLCYSKNTDERVFLFLLPSLLESWSRALEGDPGAFKVAGEWHAAMARKSAVLRAAMGPETEAGTLGFLLSVMAWYVECHGSLERPDLNWLPLWVGATCGLPDFAGAWFRKMEEMRTLRMAACYLTYLSRIVYRPFENPLFLDTDGIPEPWVRTLYITGGIGWRPESLEAARQYLAPHRVKFNLERLRDKFQDDIIQEIVRDMLFRLPQTESRIDEAIRNLGSIEPPSFWSDAFG